MSKIILYFVNAIYAEFGRFPLIIKQKVQVLKYWQKLLSFPHGHVLKQSYTSSNIIWDRTLIGTVSEKLNSDLIV